VAILTLDPEVAPVVAGRLGVEYDDLADLAQEPRIRCAVGQAVEKANESRAGQELDAAGGGVDRGVRRADSEAEAQATRGHSRYADILDEL